MKPYLMCLAVSFAVLTSAPFSYAIEYLIEGSGSATVTYDGDTNVYPLQIGFGLDTDFSNPSNVIAVFSKVKWEDALNPRRIKLRLDSTRTGSVEVNAQNKRFIFIQDGGQLHFPKTPCVIEIRKAYTGSTSSVFQGEINSCVVLSAGIEHTISAKFEVKGTPKYKVKSTYDW